jgi:hypothetical protein
MIMMRLIIMEVMGIKIIAIIMIIIAIIMIIIAIIMIIIVMKEIMEDIMIMGDMTEVIAEPMMVAMMEVIAIVGAMEDAVVVMEEDVVVIEFFYIEILQYIL